MEYRKLGRTGLKVSSVCLGTMQFGWTADQETSFGIIDRALESGCNFLDTADVYSRWVPGNDGGESETIIGNWLAKNRSLRGELVIATKVRGKRGEGPNAQGLSRKHILEEVQNSLNRLQTDYIDLYQVHSPDEETPLDETLRTLDDLVRQGVVRYIGCSNYPAWLLTKSLWISDRYHLARFDSLQPHYNMVHRDEYERELQPLCVDQEIGVIPYSPLGGGFLTGKYRRGQALPASARASGVKNRYFNERGFEVLDAISVLAKERGASVSQLAIAWILTKKGVDSAIIGANSVAQLEETMGEADITLSEEEIQELDKASSWR